MIFSFRLAAKQIGNLRIEILIGCCIRGTKFITNNNYSVWNNFSRQRTYKFQYLSLDLWACKFFFNCTLLCKNEIDQGVGEVILDLQNNDYKFETSKGLGSITINGVSYKNDIKLGEGQNIIGIDGGIGSISINTNK